MLLLNLMKTLRFKIFFVIAIFVVIGFTIYANSFKVPIFWDDEDNITNNVFIKDWQYFPQFFSENLIAGAGLVSNYWRPMLLTVLSVGWHIWEDWPAGYHFINISLHIANAVLLFFILFRLFKNNWLAFFTALIFLVHPLQTEAITPATGTADPLWFFFALLSIVFFLKKYRFLSLASFVFALISKEIAIVTPALIFIIDFFLKSGEKGVSFKEKLKEIFKKIWPFWALALFYIFLRATILNFKNSFNFYEAGTSIFASDLYIRVITFFRILTVYFGLIFRPFNLHMERTVEIASSFFSLDVILGCVIFVGLLILAFTQFKKWPIFSFGILWFFICLAPTSNILVPINNLLYEHWLYTPLVGIFIALFWFLLTIFEKKYYRWILFIIIAGYLVFLSYLTVKRNQEWHDPIVFYNQILRYTPDSYRVINNLGKTYAETGNRQMAEATYKKAINLFPDISVAYHNLANLYKNDGKQEMAEQYYKTAIAVDPDFLYSYNALALMYIGEQKYQEARQIFEKYLERHNARIDILYTLSQIAIMEKDYKGALSYLRRALLIDSQNQMIQSAAQKLMFFQ
ncbi:tetratricopeptide repeat protein [Patescibacteria group bacterium]|nr:tetratricopeptide repeat protein [Patescibacteria group bacterium]